MSDNEPKLEGLDESLWNRMSSDDRVYSLDELCNEFDCSPKELKKSYKRLKNLGATGTLSNKRKIPEAFKEEFEQMQKVSKKRTRNIDVYSFIPESQGGTGHQMRFGATSDSHMVSHHHVGNAKKQEGPLWNFYRMCAREGIDTVFHGGNYIDGACRFNKFEVRATGVTEQFDIFVNEYPYVPGVKTVFISGDDHEGWWWKRDGLDVAEYGALKANAAGRDDMEFIGYIEADIAIIPGVGFVYNKYLPSEEEKKTLLEQNLLRSDDDLDPRKHKDGTYDPSIFYPKSKGLGDLVIPKNAAIMRLMHAGGGTSYAKSLRSQKIVEVQEAGEKPQIMLIGHYHKAVSDLIRNVHTVQLGTTEDQSSFMRKKTIPADLGSYILEINQDEVGAINVFSSRFIPYVNRGYNQRLQNWTLNSGQ
ncbi:hypothetical protein GOV11_00550 [Candidatus Woesearchaeota archaeon]|nr:hypothetical protein [Candidatus Woesearchaeota archaeon]